MPLTGTTPDRLSTLKVGVTVIAVVLAAFSLWALRHILTPFILAVFLLFMIGGLEAALTRFLKVPPRAALPAAIVLVVAFFAVAIWLISANAAAIYGQSSAYVERLNLLLQMGANKLGLNAAPTIDSLFKQLNPAQYLKVAAASVGHLLEGFVFVMIYLGFMLASRGRASRTNSTSCSRRVSRRRSRFSRASSMGSKATSGCRRSSASSSPAHRRC